jgi:hypothetical protein
MKKQPTIYWKVIRKKSRSSAIITNRNVKVKYPVGEWVKPQVAGSELMVFSELNRAKQWATSMECGWTADSFNLYRGDLKVVSCHIKNPKPVTYILKLKVKNFTKKCEIFWKCIKYSRTKRARGHTSRYLEDKLDWDFSQRCPAGAISCSSVKCLE